jgi:thymidine phosphorylase
MLIPQEFIRYKRDGGALDPESLTEFVQGITANTVSDAQISAFCMAALLKGLSMTETAHLTIAMANSGTRLNWGDLNGKIVDKHSTGGVGDKVSLMLAPIVAACGLYVPMIAGRGLGHTGGTIDKLESIPGYKTNLPLDKFQNIVREIGCSIIGQTNELAPADKRIYAVRDVTATVESVPLITASILSKKLAAGLNGLVLDVKCGNGAFMSDIGKAKELANSLQIVAESAGLNLIPVITDMNQILGSTAGNSVEIIETIRYLIGEYREPRLHELTITLAAHMIVLGGLIDNFDRAKMRAQKALDSGQAAEIFVKMIAAHGGPSDILARPVEILGQAPVIKKIIADRSGRLDEMNTRDIGILLVQLKAGHNGVNDSIDPHIGFTDIAPLGTICVAGRTVLAHIHLRDNADFSFAQKAFLSALKINDAELQERKLILN